METTYFVLGMLSIIAVTFVATIIAGLLKINKQQKTIDELIERIKGLHLDHSQQFDNVYRNIDQVTNEMHRAMHEEKGELTNRLNETSRDIDIRFNDVFRSLNDLGKDCRSYTDSRIDKTTTTAKTIIKG